MNRSRLPLFLLWGMVSIFSLPAVEIKDNSSKVVFNEKDGVWSLYYNQDSKLLSLFEDRDNRTSYTDIQLDNRTYRLQKNTFFNQYVEDQSGLIVAHWSNNTLHVTQSVLTDHKIKGFRITITIRNLSKNYISVGMKRVFDTRNNADGPDFSINGSVPVNSERGWSGSEIPEYWGTFPDSETGSHFTFTPLGDRKPDQIYFANWKRLNDSGWDFNLKEGREFSLLPYSINDSAAVVYYNPVSIPPGTEITMQYALTVGGPVIAKDQPAVQSHKIAEPVSDEKGMILNFALQYDLDLIDKIVDELNSLLQKDDPVYNSQVEYYEKELEKLKQKLSHYENLQ